MRWEKGRATIERMLEDGELERVPPSRTHADELIAQARMHRESVEKIVDVDPVGAYQIGYDAARKALVAILENEGLRPTSAGGHVAVYEAVRAQLDPPLGNVIRPFNRMRRRRNELEYPAPGTPTIDVTEVTETLEEMREIVSTAGKVMDQMDPF